jgi:hypothetical protein
MSQDGASEEWLSFAPFRQYPALCLQNLCGVEWLHGIFSKTML